MLAWHPSANTDPAALLAGELCTNAHGRKQLRLEAAVQLAKVAADFKTALCDMWCLEGRCSFGSQCPAAHGVSDMRYSSS